MIKLSSARRAPRPSPPKTQACPAKGLTFARTFSHPTIAPFDEIEWELRTAEITDDSGKAIFKQENVEVPKSWSRSATKIAVSKYFYGDIAHGTDPYKGGRERSVKQLVHRVTRTITDCGIKDGYFADQASAEIFYQELTWLCVNQYGAFNSPVWFNVGLWHQYRVGEGGGEGNYYFDHKTGEARRAATQYRLPAGQRLLHPICGRQHGRHHAPRDVRGDALQVRQRDRERPVHVALDARKTVRRWPAKRPVVVPEDLRSGRGHV